MPRAIGVSRCPRSSEGFIRRVPETPPSFARVSYTGRRRLLAEVPACGWSRQRAARPGLLSHRHAGAFELCLVDDGQVQWWVEEGIYTVEAGEVFLTRPGERHGGIGAVVHPCVLYWFQFGVSRERAVPGLTLAQTRALENDLERLPQRQVRAPPALREAIKALIEEHGRRDAHSAVRARAALHATLVLLIRESREARPECVSELVGRARRWIEEHVSEHFRVADVAKRVGISSVQLQARFRRELACSVGEYRTRVRIERAKRMLVESRRAVTEIAFELGFASSQHFATAFRRRVGISPERYRRSATAPRRRAALG